MCRKTLLLLIQAILSAPLALAGWQSQGQNNVTPHGHTSTTDGGVIANLSITGTFSSPSTATIGGLTVGSTTLTGLNSLVISSNAQIGGVNFSSTGVSGGVNGANQIASFDSASAFNPPGVINVPNNVAINFTSAGGVKRRGAVYSAANNWYFGAVDTNDNASLTLSAGSGGTITQNIFGGNQGVLSSANMIYTVPLVVASNAQIGAVTVTSNSVTNVSTLTVTSQSNLGGTVIGTTTFTGAYTYTSSVTVTLPATSYYSAVAGSQANSSVIGMGWQNVQRLTSGTSWSVPAGVSRILAYIVGAGGGGGGGGNCSTITCAGGGGGGGSTQLLVSTVSGSVAYTIGTAGAAGIGNGAGGNGGNTTFLGETANGGVGGNSGSSQGLGGGPGGCTGTGICFNGNSGAPGSISNAANSSGGCGGGSALFGGGGQGGAASTGGSAGLNGGGGGGGGNVNTTTGGAGAGGFILIFY